MEYIVTDDLGIVPNVESDTGTFNTYEEAVAITEELDPNGEFNIIPISEN